MDLLSTSGVDEYQLFCVETLTFKAFFGRGGAVNTVTKKRVAKALHMHSDLMGATGLKNTANVAVSFIGGYQFPVSDSVLGVFLCDGHALTVNRMAAYGLVHSAAAFFEVASDNSFVDSVKRVV